MIKTSFLIHLLFLFAACDLFSQNPPSDIPSTQLTSKPTNKDPLPSLLGAHAYQTLPDEKSFFQFAFEGVGGQKQVKFIVYPFFKEEKREIIYLDSSFYKLHDEWFWFRLLNGDPIPGSGAAPAENLQFDSIKEVYDWAKKQDSLPLNLSWSEGERLYSEHFYQISLSYPRAFGLGTLVYLPARKSPNKRPPLWFFDLEYSDVISYEELVIYFSQLKQSLPSEVFSQLKWVLRSPAQESLARKMEAEKLPYFDRILRYEELAIPGEIEVYSAGITAGRLRLVENIETDLQNTHPADILVLKEIPDHLPAVSGLITAVPQTPLAHINILARNRGIPNVYLGGAFSDPKIEQLSSGYAWVALQASSSGELQLKAISEKEFYHWWELSTPKPLSAVEAKSTDHTLDLKSLPLNDVDSLRPIIGGKAAGFLSLLAKESVLLPDNPFAITIRPYQEHLAPFLPAITAMLENRDFLADAKIRYLVLEGPKKFGQKYSREKDKILAEKFLASFTERTLNKSEESLLKLIRKGGLVRLIRNTPIAPETLKKITTALQKQFETFSPQQGLRFRSSSTIEDIEGFNGAGLYDSNTGFFAPKEFSTAKEKKKRRSIEEAILRTWASYWSFEAFEERQLEFVDHLSGNMAVLVHARFDDELEKSNGVFTFTLLPDTENSTDYAVMELNVQADANSVTNPESGTNDLPEVDRVFLSKEKETSLRLERVKSSTLLPKGEVILSETELEEIFLQAKAVSEAWRLQKNQSLSPSQQIQTLTLDFEFRQMKEGWPQMTSGELRKERIILKQARSLEPGLENISRALRDREIPRDILARASSVLENTFAKDFLTLRILRLFCDPLATPDFECKTTPFVAEITLEISNETEEKTPEFFQKLPPTLHWNHVTISNVLYEKDKTDWKMSIFFQNVEENENSEEQNTSQNSTISSLTISSGGTFRLQDKDKTVLWETTLSPVSKEVLFSSPEDYLLRLLSEK